MQCQQTTGIDLPQKILVWEDSAGQVWITYNDPNNWAQRYGITETCAETIAKVEKALSIVNEVYKRTTFINELGRVPLL